MIIISLGNYRGICEIEQYYYKLTFFTIKAPESLLN